MTDSEKLDLLLCKMQSMEGNVATVKDDVSKLKEEMVEVKLDIAELKSDVSELKEEVVEVKSDIAELKSDVSELKEDMVEVKSDIAELKSDVSELKEDMVEVKVDISVMKDGMSNISQRLHSVEMTLENETNKNIRFLAQCHQDLLAKLNESLKIREKDEMLQIRVNTLERQVKALNDHVFAKTAMA